MIRHIAFSAILAGTALAWHPALAQGLEPGAMAGKSYLPSTHTKGCSGLLCDSDDPRRQAYSAAVAAGGAQAAAVAPPPCQGLLCSMTPYGMGRPVTAAEAQQAALAAQRAAPPPAAEEPARKTRSARRKKAAKTVAVRTPDPTPAAAQ